MEPANGICPGLGKVVADIVGFIVLGLTAIYIGISNSQYKGHSGRDINFCGHEEQTMLSFFVNLFACVAYFARIVANGSCQTGFVVFTSIRYFDYVIVCPLLVLDLLWNLESPYKWTCSALMMVAMVHGIAAFTSPAPGSYVWFAGGVFVFTFAYLSIIYLVLERLKHFSASAASDSQNQAAVGFLKVSAGCFFFIWIWYPLLYVLSPKITNIITGETQDIIHMILDVCAKSVYGFVSLSFRYRFDKSFLRGITEEEYVEFSKRSPQRRAIRMQIRLGEGEGGGDDKPPAFQIQVQDDELANKFSPRMSTASTLGDKFSPRSSAPAPPSLGVSRQAVKGSGMVQPWDAPPVVHSLPVGASDDGSGWGGGNRSAPGGGPGGARLFFPSNQRANDDGRQRVMFGGQDFGGMSEAVNFPTPDATPLCLQDRVAIPPLGEKEGWLASLEGALRAAGLGRHGVVEDAVERLEKAGVREEQLRRGPSDVLLRALGLSLGARRAILQHYESGAPGEFMDLEEGWLARLADELRAAGLTKEGVVEDAVTRISQAGVKEEELRSGAEEALRSAGIPLGPRRAIARLYQ
jgi:bacteriorhodopsin